MPITVDRKKFLDALTYVTGVVERRTNIPICTHVLIHAYAETLTLTGTDLDHDASASVEIPGHVGRRLYSVSAHLLHGLVKKLPGLDIELTPVNVDADGVGDGVRLIAKKSQFQLQTLPALDFPTLGEAAMTHTFEIEPSALASLLGSVRFAVSTDATRYYICGVYLCEADGKLRAVATDGHRLAMNDSPLPVVQKNDTDLPVADGIPGIIIPTKTVNEIIKLCDSATAPVEVSLSPTRIAVTGTGRCLVSKLIDGCYPDYMRVIPQGNDRALTVAKTDFLEAVDRVSTLAVEKGRAVKFVVGADTLGLVVNSPDVGSATEELDAAYGAEPMEIGFNARYLMDTAAAIEGGEMTFVMGDPSSPVIIRDSGNDGALFVLMPMRI